jgi:hypothetical protein
VLKKNGTKKRPIEDTTSERDVRPLPLRAGAPANEDFVPADPRPLKRRRDDSWEIGRYQYAEEDVPQLTGERLYTISEDSLNEDNFNAAPTHPTDREFQSHVLHDMNSMEYQPTSQYFAHRQPHYISSWPARSQAPSSFRELLAQGPRPPPSSRSLNQHYHLPGQPFTHRHPSSQPGPSHHNPSSEAGPSHRALPVAGPSRIDESMPPQAFYRSKSRKSLVDLARLRHEEMDWM